MTIILIETTINAFDSRIILHKAIINPLSLSEFIEVSAGVLIGNSYCALVGVSLIVWYMILSNVLLIVSSYVFLIVSPKDLIGDSSSFL